MATAFLFLPFPVVCVPVTGGPAFVIPRSLARGALRHAQLGTQEVIMGVSHYDCCLRRLLDMLTVGVIRLETIVGSQGGIKKIRKMCYGDSLSRSLLLILWQMESQSDPLPVLSCDVQQLFMGIHTLISEPCERSTV
jgi:hypothetical protein